MKREEFVASIKVSNQEIITHLSRVWKKKIKKGCQRLKSKGWKRHRPEEMGKKQANPTLNEIGKEKGRSYRGNNKQTKNK